jgi:hypothetical protein
MIDIEIAQSRDLDIECLAVRRRWTNPHAGHAVFAAGRIAMVVAKALPVTIKPLFAD